MCRTVKGYTWYRVSKAHRASPLFVHYIDGFLEYKWAYTGAVRKGSRIVVSNYCYNLLERATYL